MRWVKIVLGVLAAIAIISGAAFVEYYLPATAKVQITGTEVVRRDWKGGAEDTPALSRDVRYIVSQDVESLETRVFRNEDTGWGWPPYFKFDSGDVAGEATNIARARPEATVLVTYYGWRIPLLSMYPNAIEIEVVEPDYTHIPIFNILFLTAIGALVLWLTWKVWRWRRGRAERARAGAESGWAGS